MSISWAIETHDSVKSTQDIVKGMGAIGQPEGIVVQALEQTQGYGRESREWVSNKGNLYISVLLKPSCGAKDIGQFALVAGLAVGRAVQMSVSDPEMIQLKWPNDVLIGGQKCAGLIVESEIGGNHALKWVTLGVGINLASAPAGIGTFIGAHNDSPPKLNALRDRFLKQLDKYYVLWTNKGFDPIKEQWLEMAHKKGDPVSVKIGDDIIEGAFHGLDDTGALLLADEQLRVKKITSGDVYV